MASSFTNARRTYLWTIQSDQITDHLPKPTTVSDPPINFTKEVAFDDSTILMMMPWSSTCQQLTLTPDESQWTMGAQLTFSTIPPSNK